MKAPASLVLLQPHYDLVIIGGGVTGAGIAQQAIRSGARVLLVERGDFAAATSSASSKLVHGGLRYLSQGAWRLTLESVRERQRLIKQASGLVEPLKFLMPVYRDTRPGRYVLRAGLWLYDRMSGTSKSRWLSREIALRLQPQLREQGLLGAITFEDAQTDDARLVLRLLFESAANGLELRNYTQAALRYSDGRVSGVDLEDVETSERRSIDADLVINATGAWADQMPGAPQVGLRLRPLRGSHLIFPAARLPLEYAVSWPHPRDRRPVFAYPWEGATLCGTTDLDHDGDLSDIRAGAGELAYLLEGLTHQFPRLALSLTDAIAVYAGVRPVVDGGKDDPSAESRESAIWSSPGLINVTGGKLTTFRVTAKAVLELAAQQHPRYQLDDDAPVFSAAEAISNPSRLQGRLGAAAADGVMRLPAAELIAIGHSPYSWAELRWAARHEQVRHLGDLMLRRTRLGLVLPQGGAAWLPQIRTIVCAELGWDEAQWAREERGYLEHWQRYHAPQGI